MSLHGDLLVQARHLALVEPRRPRQASLRRAISASYFARFARMPARTPGRPEFFHTLEGGNPAWATRRQLYSGLGDDKGNGAPPRLAVDMEVRI